MPRIVTASQSCSHALRVFVLTDRNDFRVGRRDPGEPATTPEIDLHPDSRVSRKHCRVTRHGRIWKIEDTGSKYGTFLNGKDIGRERAVDLPPEAEVRTGDTSWILVPDNWLLIPCETLAVFGPASRQVSYAAYHCGTPVVGELHVRNLGARGSTPHRICMRIPDYSDICEVHVPALEPHSETVLGIPCLRLHGDMLRRLLGAARSRLMVTLDHAESPELSPDVGMLGMWDWSHAADARRTVAAFVSPHDPVVVALMRDATKRLAQEEGISSFEALLASGRRDAERIALGVVYRCLASQPGLSWERPAIKTCFDGGPLYQSIRPPHQIISSSPGSDNRATCLDLAVLMASCIENCGACPVILFAGEKEETAHHAFVGCWAGSSPGERPVIHDSQFLLGEVESGNLFVCECTGVLDRGPDDPKLSFEQALAAAGEIVRETPAMSAVDIGALRPPFGPITPMDCALAPELARAYDEAMTFANKKNREAIETGFLLYGLLASKGALTVAVFKALAVDSEEKRRCFLNGIHRRSRAAEPQPTWNYLECRRLAEAYAWYAGSRTVREQDLWWALLDRGAQSNSLQSALRLAGIGYPELRAALVRVCPRPEAADGDPFLASKPWSSVYRKRP